jgi:hypothetical protein
MLVSDRCRIDDHVKNQDKLFECDHCVGLKIAKENNSIFFRLPFPEECEGNIFGKPEKNVNLMYPQ